MIYIATDNEVQVLLSTLNVEIEWTMINGYELYKRSFIANDFEKGTSERTIFNKDGLTSEYYTSNKYIVVYWRWQNWSQWDAFTKSFKTKNEALTFIESEAR